MAILADKQVKKTFKKEASKYPKKYYATSVLEAEGFNRGHCTLCGTYFWSTDKERKICGDASCTGGFNILNENPASKQLTYTEVWKEFKQHFEKEGYQAVKRFPVIARWNPTTEFTIASIAAFQPYVVSGEAKAPAKKLVIPQFCLRFGDIDNVGITMSHLTGFVMIGQHQFVEEKEWDQDKVFAEILSWLTEGLGLPKSEITFHEDAWAGGGNYGPCMEYFSRGVELGNQVYMLFEQTEEGPKELTLKVLDMGMGMERNAWFSQAATTIYDATFPYVINKLLEKTGVKKNEELIKKYMPYGAYLNMDEVEDVGAAWEEVAKKMGVSVKVLREKLEPMTAIYSIAEHARSLLLALADGGLPSNVGGGYNLRAILRRALSFIEKFGWEIDIYEVCTWHAQELRELFPELKEALPDIKQILESEKNKFVIGRKRNKQLLLNELKKGTPSVEKLITLYDSHGITPEEVKQTAKEAGLKIAVPENFYALVAEHQEQSESVTATKKDKHYEVDELPATEALYFNHYDYVDFEGHVLKIIDKQYVVLDRSAFYPTSGGQLHDIGTLGGVEVVDVIKQATPQGMIIIHELAKEAPFTVGDKVSGRIDLDRRRQLAQHHTATHILTGSCKQVLGNHIWQAGAAKTVEKSRLDISHYEQLSDEEIARIEEVANKVVDENRPVIKSFMARDIAEAQHGMRLYQGGAVPGNKLRIVNIEGFDVEACGGTHLDVTGDAGHIKIIKTSKLQDGIVRIEFVAGAAADKAMHATKHIIKEAVQLVGGTPAQLPGRVEELFQKWKKAKKGKLETFTLESEEEYDGDVIAAMAANLKTQPEHVIKTIKRFLEDIEKKVGK